MGGDGRTATPYCLGKGKLRVTKEKRTEKDEVLEVRREKAVFYKEDIDRVQGTRISCL